MIMKKIITCIMLLCLFNNVNYVAKAANANVSNIYTITDGYDVIMKQDLLCLMMSYPEYITGVKRENNGLVYLIMKSGKRVLYDDKKVKTFEQKLANPDLQDMMEQIYPLSPVIKLMDKNFDPGRSRCYELLTEVYGTSQNQVQSNLKKVSLGYKNFQFNGNNKAAESLQSAMKELIPLANQRHDINTCLFPCSGTFNYRVISGTNRLSPHAFGIAIDFARDKRDYWKWATPEDGEKRLLSYPKEFVEILEKNNFIWGGKWEHFDILHFEYRPEIIMKSKYFGDKGDTRTLWYMGLSLGDTSTKNFIQIIDEALQ